MHNWHCLLLAILAVSQPIESFTEHNLVNGRQQCSDRPALLRDTRLSLYGSSTKPCPEERRLNYRETREVRRDNRRYAVRDDSSVFTPAERRVVEHRARQAIWVASEQSPRYSRIQDRRERDLSRDQIAENRARFSRDERIRSRNLDGEDHRERSTRDLRDESQIRETRRGDVEHRTERSYSSDGNTLSIDARCENRRTRDVANQRTTETRDTHVRASFNRAREEVTPVEAHRNREVNRMNEQRISSRRDSRLQMNERRSERLPRDTERRSISLNSRLADMRQRSVDAIRAETDRREIRDRSSSARNYARRDSRVRSASRRVTLLERSPKFFEYRPYREERRSASETLNRINERESRVRSINHRAVRAERLEYRSNSERHRIERSISDDRDRVSTARQVDLSRQNERSLSRENNNIRMENNRLNRNTDEARQVISRRSNDRESRIFERTESRSNDRLRLSGDRRTDLNRRNRSIETRIYSRQNNERVRDEVRDTEMREIRVQNVRDQHKEAKRSYDENSRNRHYEQRRDDSRRSSESIRRERTANVRQNDDIRRDTSRNTERVHVENRRMETRRVPRLIVARLSDINNFENRRLDSMRKNERSRDSIERLPTKNVDRTRASENSRSLDMVLEARNLRLERDTIDLARNRNSWNLVREKELTATTQSFTMNWQYLVYTLQGIYLSTVLLQVLGSSNTKKIRSQALWTPAQNVLKLD